MEFRLLEINIIGLAQAVGPASSLASGLDLEQSFTDLNDVRSEVDRDEN